MISFSNLFLFFKASANDHRQILKEKFKKIKYFSSSTDIWSRSNRSFIAVSVHYFDSTSDKCAEPVLKTDFIACAYFSGRHTHDRVAEKLSAIFERFGIKEKVFFATTDGAGEYVAAFKYFGDDYQSIYLNDENDVDISVAGNSSVANSHSPATSCQEDSIVQNDFEDDSSENFIYKGDSSTSLDMDSFVIHDLDSIFGTESDGRILGKMNRIDCSAHKIDKLASIDADKVDDGSDYAKIHSHVFGKLHQIWSLKDSRISAEIFKQLTGKCIIGPHRIRWIKLYEAVRFNSFI